MTKASTPCAFCGGIGTLSTEHVIPKWLRKALLISGPVKEYSDTTYRGAAQTLALVFHEVCASCNNGWLSNLETAVRPVLEPLLLGVAPDAANLLDQDEQAVLATWAVKTALLLTLGKFRRAGYGWVSPSTLRWLYDHRALQVPPPGTRVWMGGLHTRDVPAYIQAGSLYDAIGITIAQVRDLLGRLRPVPGVRH